MFIGIVAYWEGWTPLRPAEQRARAAILGPVVGSPPSPAPLQYGSKATAHVAAPKTVGQIGRPHARPPCGALSAPAPAWHYGRRAARTQITRAAPWPRRGEGARVPLGSRAPTTRPAHERPASGARPPMRRASPCATTRRALATVAAARDRARAHH